MTVVLNAEKWWECPSCHVRHVTRVVLPHVPMHLCAEQNGLTVPFVQVKKWDVLGGVRHVIVERDDYVGGEQGLRFDPDGRPVMAVRTERADGSNDVHAFAATATTNVRGVN